MSSKVKIEVEAPSDEPRTVALTLARDFLGWRERRGRAHALTVALDFARRRCLRIDEGAGTFVDGSLHAEVGRRHVALPSRELGGGQRQGAGCAGSAFAALLAEHHLSLRSPNRIPTIAVEVGLFRRRPGTLARADVVVQVGDDEVRYRAGDQVLLTHARHGLDAPADGFAQLLRYRFGGHPLILAAVARLRFIPRWLSLHAVDSGLLPMTLPRTLPGLRADGEVTLRVGSLRPASGERPSTAGLREVVDLDGEEPDDAAISPSGRGAAAAAAGGPGAEPRIADALSLMRSGRALQGALRFFELTLEAGADPLPEVAAAMRASADDRVTALMASLGGAKDAASARHTLATYDVLRGTITGGSPALDAFEAEVRLALGETDEAKRLLGRAIAANPRLTGAYRTLGDVHLAAGDAGRAWRCWELARALCPVHPLLKQPAAFEEMLVALHPEYFVAPSLGVQSPRGRVAARFLAAPADRPEGGHAAD